MTGKTCNAVFFCAGALPVNKLDRMSIRPGVDEIGGIDARQEV